MKVLLVEDSSSMRSWLANVIESGEEGVEIVEAANGFEALKTLRARGMTILLVEQNVNTTLRIVDRAYVLEQGRVVLEGSGDALLSNTHVQEAYLGI